MLVGFLILDILLTYLGFPTLPLLLIPVCVVFILSFPLGFEIWGGLRSFLIHRFGKRLSQRFAACLGIGLALSSLSIHALTLIKIIPLWGFIIAPFLQGFGLSLARQTPSYYQSLFLEYERRELVERLDGVAKKHKIDPKSNDAMRELDRLVMQTEAVGIIEREHYKRQKPWVWEDLRKRWRAEEVRAVSDVFTMWTEIVQLRTLIREELRRRTGFGFIPERESLFVVMSRLPESYGEVVSQVMKLKEYIDDFDSKALKRVTGRTSRQGSKSLRTLLRHLGITADRDPSEIWRRLREIRHGLAHPDPKGHSHKFIDALVSLELEPDSFYYEPKRSWSKISKAYCESLKILADCLDMERGSD